MMAEEWYREFYRRYYFHKSVQGKAFDELDKKDWTLAEWAKHMDLFLQGMAESLGYAVARDSKIEMDKRVEHRWSKGGHDIFIVHEADGRRVSKEIGRLGRDESRLTVLITSVPDQNFVAHTMRLAKKVREEIDLRGRFRGEFLLVVGGTEIDWTAVKSVARVEMEPLIVPQDRGKKS